MDGDVAPLDALVETGARVIVDEAHATGVIGPRAAGSSHELGPRRIDVDHDRHARQGARQLRRVRRAATREIADYLVNRARTLIYSTALPPPSIGAALKALELMDRELRRPAARQRARRCARRSGVEVSRHADRPAGRRRAGDGAGASAAALEQGVFAQAIRPPTVPEGTSRLRLVATAAHDPDDLRPPALLCESLMSYSSSRREVVPTGGVRQHGR